jgi:hypothetical protein
MSIHSENSELLPSVGRKQFGRQTFTIKKSTKWQRHYCDVFTTCQWY